MANQKISELDDGNRVLITDHLVLERSGGNVRANVGVLANQDTVIANTQISGNIPVAGGGTGSGTAGGARTNLDAQQKSARLGAIADLSATAGLFAMTGSQSISDRIITGVYSQITVTNGNGVSGNPTIGLATGIASGKQTMWIPGTAMLKAITNGPTTGQFETTTNKVNVRTVDFDSTGDEYVHFQIAFPKKWNESTVTFQVWWTSESTTTDGVAWALQGVSFSDSLTLDTAYGTAVVVTDDAQSAAKDVYITAESTAVTIAGTPAVDELVSFRFLRDVSDANDDMVLDAKLIGIKLFWTTDSNNDD